MYQKYTIYVSFIVAYGKVYILNNINCLYGRDTTYICRRIHLQEGSSYVGTESHFIRHSTLQRLSIL